MSKETEKELLETISILRDIVTNTLWMARRYADNRATFAPSIVNESIDAAKRLGLFIEKDVELGDYAKDMHLGKWNPALGRFEKG